MKASDILIEKIKEFEGCRLEAYKCPAGVWTIGVGHTKGVKQGQKITMAQAESLLKNDLMTFEKYVNELGVCKTQGQFDALVDFAFNLGTAALGGSTLLKYIKLGKPIILIKAQFKKWNKARVNGKLVELAGLTKRRSWEAQRYEEK